MDAALSSIIADEAIFSSQSCCALDLIATIRPTVNVPNTFRPLADKLLLDIPLRFYFIFVACDTYPERSIKNSERR